MNPWTSGPGKPREVSITKQEFFQDKFGSSFSQEKFDQYQKFLRQRHFIKQAAKMKEHRVKIAELKKDWKPELWLTSKKEDDGLEPL